LTEIDDAASEGTIRTISGLTEELDGGRSVFVGQCPGEDKVYIKFHNGETETKLRLSFEAAQALRDLLGAISSRGLMSMSTWICVTHAVGTSGETPDEGALAS
jgi:hypothetical protein